MQHIVVGVPTAASPRVISEELAAILAYQAAVDATKSVERDAADVANAREIARAKELGIDLDA
jgi:hypothetical protein